MVRLQTGFCRPFGLIVENREEGFSRKRKKGRHRDPLTKMVIIPSKACSSSRGCSSKFFFLFPTITVPLFSPVVWQKICPKGRIRALVRAASNETRTIFSMEILVQLSRRRMSRHMRTLSSLFSFPSLFTWIKVDLFSPSIFPFYSSRFFGYRIIRMDKFVTLNEIRTNFIPLPRVYVCEITKRKRFRANVNIHDAAKEFQLEVGSVNFNHNYSRPLFIGCSV